MRLHAAGILHLGDLLVIGLEGESIQGEGRRLIFNFEGILIIDKFSFLS